MFHNLQRRLLWLSRRYHSTEKKSVPPRKILTGPNLQDFLRNSGDSPRAPVSSDSIFQIPAYLSEDQLSGLGRRVFIETYGCQMNFSDTEIVQSVLTKHHFDLSAKTAEEADVVFLMTCAIRENAEEKVWHRLNYLHSLHRRDEGRPVIGVLGCMAERLKEKLLTKGRGVDLVVGPDAYRTLPQLLAQVNDGDPAVNVLLSADETYADIAPVRTGSSGVSAYVSIMRGCNNMCAFCIVPFTRGRERSRPVDSILAEVQALSQSGCREITLLGQNVNSYCDTGSESSEYFARTATHSKDMKSLARSPESGVRFAELLDRVARVDPEMRIRFTSPHPQYFPDSVLDVMATHTNVCKQIHMPAQSGSTNVLQRMRRGYTREAYMALADRIRERIPSIAFSSDFIAGFCGESEEDHRQTVQLMEWMQYETAFTFAYSMREKTHAYHRYEDDVPADVKQRRLEELVGTFRKGALARNSLEVGKKQLVLVSGPSKRAEIRGLPQLMGRTDTNKLVVFDDVPVADTNTATHVSVKPGDYVECLVENATHTTLYATSVRKSSIAMFARSIA